MSISTRALMKLRHQPWFLQTYYRRMEDATSVNRILRKGDDVLIDGYPRSANTFATHAFIDAQPAPVKVGNHMHNPAQFHLAKRFGIPALLLVREPLDACASLMLRRRWVDPEPALLRYIAFHADLPSSEHFVVGHFPEVTADFAETITRINRRFGTNFANFQHDESARNRIFERMTEKAKERKQVLGVSFNKELGTAQPSEEKAAMKRQVLGSFEKGSARTMLKEARELYDGLVAGQR